ncbi:hypothetical protein RB195_007520 [Necator americanus]|uniref:WH2 domain-containing protein n=1 Tax=Necator americanus TaxID=51031 RepID=A0ABR1BZ85_NECAM
MWQYIVSSYFSIHYLWFSVVFTQVLISNCSKKAKPTKQVTPTKEVSPFKPVLEAENPSADNNSKESKESKEKATQKDSLSAEKEGSRENEKNQPPGWDINKIKQSVEARQRDSTKTDLRSVQDVLFLLKPRNFPAQNSPLPGAPGYSPAAVQSKSPAVVQGNVPTPVQNSRPGVQGKEPIAAQNIPPVVVQGKEPVAAQNIPPVVVQGKEPVAAQNVPPVVVQTNGTAASKSKGKSNKALPADRTQVVMLERQEDREMSMLIPTDSFLNPQISPSQPMSFYDPLRIQPPVEESKPPLKQPDKNNVLVEAKTQMELASRKK